ncbi:MAG: His/Gly/Thr/Pro-type tRNA ligase C-terminal domain-containing protein [Candidatus Babeliales bacterium]
MFDEATKTSYIPHVVECSVGVDRLFLTLLFDAYAEDVIEGETRTVLRLHPRIAPYIAAVMPLTNKLDEQAHTFFTQLKGNGFQVQYDVSGSIGKRYRRQDEIGTPVCFTYDFDTLNDHKVTARNRDTTKQERIVLDQVENYLRDLVK